MSNEAKKSLEEKFEVWGDQQDLATGILDYVIESDVEAAAQAQTKKDSVLVKDARRSERLLEVDSDRKKSRLLVVTSTREVCIAGHPSQEYYHNLATLFDEIHIIVVGEGKKKDVAQRLGNNLFLYTATGRFWWSMCWQARSIAYEHLTFGGVARPDIVTATDPFLAGLSGYLIARGLKRPWQLQMSVDPFAVSFVVKDKKNKWLRRNANFILARVSSVRTSTEQLLKKVQTRFKNITDAQLLPHYYNFESFKSSTPTFDVHEKYSHYSFIMLAQADLVADSHLHDVFAALRQALLNPRVGLVVIGDGPAKALFVEKVALLGIKENVVFVSDTNDLVSFYKTADALVEAGTTANSEENVLRAIAAGLPVVAYETPQRLDLLVDGESGFLCEAGDSYVLGKKLNKILNSSALRVQFKRQEKDIADFRLHENAQEYFLAVRDSIEAVLVEKTE